MPELITGADPGELFNVRNIANVVPPADSTDSATGAAVEYAVIHLGVQHIVVCGHTECGGIAALAGEPEPERQPNIVSWLEFARPARERALAAGVAEEDLYLETIKTNVLIQMDNLRTYPSVAEGEAAGNLDDPRLALRPPHRHHPGYQSGFRRVGADRPPHPRSRV